MNLYIYKYVLALTIVQKTIRISYHSVIVLYIDYYYFSSTHKTILLTLSPPPYTFLYPINNWTFNSAERKAFK